MPTHAAATAAHTAAHATTAHAAAHATATHAAAHTAAATPHAAELSGRSLSDDAGREDNSKLTAGLVGDRHRHPAVPSSFGIDGDQAVANGIQEINLRQVVVGLGLVLVGFRSTCRPFDDDKAVWDCDEFFASSAEAIVKGNSPRTRAPASAVNVGSDNRMK